MNRDYGRVERVLRADRTIGGYRGGSDTKRTIIEWKTVTLRDEREPDRHVRLAGAARS